MEKFQTKSPEETHQLAKEVVNNYLQNGGRPLALIGHLGSGKTTFVQGLAKHLGINQPITSPTFILMKSYDLNSALTNSKRLIHIDLYRLKNSPSQQELGFSELFEDPENLVVLEWADKLEENLPENTLKIYFEIKNDSREIQIED